MDLETIRRKRAECSEHKDVQQEPTPKMTCRRPAVLDPHVVFYGVEDLMEILGWSKHTVLELFHDPGFPGTNFGRSWRVEAEALREYFSVRRTKQNDKEAV